MGGMNTWTPIRPFVPTYADTPLLSEDVKAIRMHYGLKCNEGKFQISEVIFRYKKQNKTKQNKTKKQNKKENKKENKTKQRKTKTNKQNKQTNKQNPFKLCSFVF